MPHMEGIFINGEKAKFHPEDILDTDASQYTEEIGESVTAYLTEHLTNPSNPPIDTSLSIAGAAADAKETGDQISQLKSDLTAVTFLNLYDSSKVVSGYYYNDRGIEISNANSQYINEYIAVDSSKTYIANKDSLQILTYTADKTFIARAYNLASAETPFTFDSNVAFVRISRFNAPFGADFVFCDNDAYKYLAGESVVINGEKIANLEVSEGKTTFFTKSDNLLDLSACTKGKFVSSSGYISDSETSEISDLISVKAGDVINFTPQSYLYIAIYNTSGNFSTRVSVSELSTYTAPIDGYIRFARYQLFFDTKFMATINHALPTDYEAFGTYIFQYADNSGKDALKIAEEMKYAGTATKTATSITVTLGKLRVIVNKYNDSTIRAYDLWRTSDAYIRKSDGSFTRLWYNSDSDGVVKIKDEDDFIGGYHGDETQTAFHLFVDGVEYSESAAFTDLKFDELILYCESDVYHCNTSATPDAVAFKRKKTITFNNDGYIVENNWIAQEALVLIRAYTGMLSVERYIDNTYTEYLLTGYHTNYDYAYVDADTGTGAKPELTKVLFHTIYGDVGIKMDEIQTPATYYGDVTNYNSSYDKRLKAYMSNINSNAGVSISQGAVIKAKATTFVR